MVADRDEQRHVQAADFGRDCRIGCAPEIASGSIRRYQTLSAMTVVPSAKSKSRSGIGRRMHDKWLRFQNQPQLPVIGRLPSQEL